MSDLEMTYRSHECPDWDGLSIRPGDPEMDCCTCPDPTLKLMACPFCGSAPAFGICDGGEDDPNHGGKFIECSNCHVSTPLIFPVMDDVTGPLSDIWNRRLKA